MGKKVGLVDLTTGQLGSRGTPVIRLSEAEKAAKILGLHFRENLEMEDGFFLNNFEHQEKIIRSLRKFQPEIVITNAVNDRHPDHGKAAKLVSDACFYSGLRRIETVENGFSQEAWRPKAVYHAIQDRYIAPDFVVDVTAFVEQKFQSILAYDSQFYNPDSTEPDTPISSQSFLETVKGRMRDFGRSINVDFAEGFTVERPPGVHDITQLV